MRDHDWERLLHDGGHLGAYESWECRRCGATNWGHPELGGQPDPEQFYACGCGPNVTALAADCNAAQVWIAAHRKICTHIKKTVERK